MTTSSSSRRLAAGRGRRVLLWACCFFAAAQLVGGLLLDHRWPDVRFPQAGKVLARLKAHDRPPEMVFMGSSRFEGAIQPRILDPLLRRYTREAPRTFNAAVGAGDVVVAERLLDRILRTGHRPALLVVEVSPEHLCRRSPLISQQVIRQMTWADLPDYLPDACLYSPVLRLLSSRLTPLYMHRYQIRKQALGALLGPADGPTAGPGPSAQEAQAEPNLRDLPPDVPPLPCPPPGTAVVGPPIAFMTPVLKDYRLSPTITQALHRLLERCRAEGIDVLLIGAPVMKGHRELYTPAIDAAYLGYIRSLEAKYGCRFVDFRDRVPDHGFGDALHVNLAGAEYFSRILAREVLVPHWRKMHPSAGPQ